MRPYHLIQKNQHYYKGLSIHESMLSFQILTHIQRFRTWWGAIQGNNSDSAYENLDEANESSFNFFQCVSNGKSSIIQSFNEILFIMRQFAFADRCDCLLMIAGTFSSILYSINFLIIVYLFADMTVSFASQSFVGSCEEQLNNTSISNIELEWNLHHQGQYQYVSDYLKRQLIISVRVLESSVQLTNNSFESFTSSIEWLSFRKNIMNKIFILLCKDYFFLSNTLHRWLEVVSSC